MTNIRSCRRFRKCLVFSALCGLTSVAAAGDLKYDQNATDKASIFRSVESQTQSCMYDAVRAQLRMGTRDSGQVIMFAVQACGGALWKFLFDGWDPKMRHPTNEEIAGRLYDMAMDELRRVPGLSIELPPANGAQSLNWNMPATLVGTLQTGTFSNCCFNGKAIKDKYYFVRLEEKIAVNGRPNDDVEPPLQGVQMIQLGGINAANFPSARVGAKVSVICKELWPGNTGHYALPVYCSDARVSLAAPKP